MTTNDNKGVIGYGSVNSGVSKYDLEYNAGNLPLSSDVGTFSLSNVGNVATVLGVAPLSLGNTQEKKYPKVEKELFYYNARIDTTLNLKKFDEGVYFDELKNLIQEYNVVKKEILLESHGEDVHKQLEEELAHHIGRLNDLFDLPPEYRYLVKENKKLVNYVQEGGGEIKIGINTNLVAGSLSSFVKMIETGVIDAKNITIKAGNGSNMQEGIRTVKPVANSHNGEITYFDPNKDKLKEFIIDLGGDSSVAHSTVFKSKDLGNNNFEYTLKTGKNVFLGINSQIGSGVKIGNDTTIWWESVIGDDVTIGNNVIVGFGCKIEDKLTIPDNCLVPNGAIIQRGFKTIEYQEYIDNELKYDTTEIGQNLRRSFIIKLSDDVEKQKRQMNDINKDYGDMADFNKYHVTPENKLFAVLNTLLAIIEKHFEKSVLQEFIYKSPLTLDELKKKLPGLDDEYLLRELTRDTNVTLKGFPKDKEDFITKIMLNFIEFIQNNSESSDKRIAMEEEIKNNLDFPEIKGKIEETLIGTCFLIGKMFIDKNCFGLDLFARSDERGKEDVVRMINCKGAKFVIHGPGSTKLKDCYLAGIVVHGATYLSNCTMGSIGSHSVVNGSLFEDVTQQGGGLSANQTTVRRSTLGSEILLNPDSIIEDCTVGNGAVIGASEIYNKPIEENTIIGSGGFFRGVNLVNTALSGFNISLHKNRGGKGVNK